ncbi:heavy-metal-associated domain-containing protein [Aldersonia kunmingensis]|uniref:heavy-metal-associated domain-containing protein n=1 Tax=Aldersonia kunmingensis TaxID=408066 RepID=UPI0008299BAC|nr:heavy-metal-associated domain-containing protein [Aldersonia kunmingensis]
MSTSTFTVTGMTCGHCVSAVREEVGNIAGVETVDVDLESGRLVIESGTPLADADVIAAVDEAGYQATRQE